MYPRQLVKSRPRSELLESLRRQQEELKAALEEEEDDYEEEDQDPEEEDKCSQVDHVCWEHFCFFELNMKVFAVEHLKTKPWSPLSSRTLWKTS